MYDEFIHKCCTEPGVFVGTVNTLLTQFVHSGDLLPISLKMKTSQTTMAVKETNMHEWKNSDKIEIIKSKFTTDPFMFMNVLERSKEISFGGGPNKMDGGNSLQYFADFKVGDYNTKYLIEYRFSEHFRLMIWNLYVKYLFYFLFFRYFGPFHVIFFISFKLFL